MAKTIGFYQSFGLDLNRVGLVLQAVAANPNATYNEIGLTVGTNKRATEGAVNWTKHLGLITRNFVSRKGYVLTNIGKLIYESDSSIQDLNTYWILHYFLTVEHQERSEAWYLLFNSFLSPNRVFTANEFQNYFIEFVSDIATNSLAVEKDPITAIRTYLRDKGLIPLNLIEQQDKETFVVSRFPRYPDPYVLGFMLMDWWDRHYPNDRTLTLRQLHEEPESIGRLAVATISQVQQWVNALAGYGLVAYSDSQHQPVTRLNTEPAIALLEHYYRQR